MKSHRCDVVFCAEWSKAFAFNKMPLRVIVCLNYHYSMFFVTGENNKKARVSGLCPSLPFELVIWLRQKKIRTCLGGVRRPCTKVSSVRIYVPAGVSSEFIIKERTEQSMNSKPKVWKFNINTLYGPVRQFFLDLAARRPGNSQQSRSKNIAALRVSCFTVPFFFGDHIFRRLYAQ